MSKVITKQGMDMTNKHAHLDCGNCGCEWDEPVTELILICDGGDIPLPGETLSHRAISACPNCNIQVNQQVRLLDKEFV